MKIEACAPVSAAIHFAIPGIKRGVSNLRLIEVGADMRIQILNRWFQVINNQLKQSDKRDARDPYSRYGPSERCLATRAEIHFFTHFQFPSTSSCAASQCIPVFLSSGGPRRWCCADILGVVKD